MTILFKCLIFCIFICSSLSGQKSQEYHIIKRLFENYDKNIRPPTDYMKPVTLKLGITIAMIYDLDEKNEILTTILWMNQEWMDERLSWNSSQYELVEKIRIPCGKIWLPDIVLFNSVHEKYNEYHKSLITLYNTGRLFWQPIVTMQSSCRLDISYFPFDDQICVLKLGSWAYSNNQLEVKKLISNVDLSKVIEHGEWNIFNTTSIVNEIFHHQSNESYSELSFYLKLKRRNLYYIINVTFPCIMLSMLTLVAFILPSESGEKVTLSLTVLLLYSVFLLMVTEKMPATSEFTPLIGIYISVNMGLTSISVMLVVIGIKIHHHGNQPRIPYKNQSLISYSDRLTANQTCIDWNIDEYPSISKLKSCDTQIYYQTLARRIDKYIGILFSVLTIIITLFLIVVKPLFRQEISKF